MGLNGALVGFNGEYNGISSSSSSSAAAASSSLKHEFYSPVSSNLAGWKIPRLAMEVSC